MSLSRDIAKFNKKTEEVISTVFRRSALITFTSVIKRTPVKAGTLRANWQMGIGVAPTGIVPTTGKSFGPAIAKVSAGMKKVKNGDTLYLLNNLPYASHIEDGNSKQAPQGMVKLAVAEWNHTVALQAKKNRKSS
jgi:hypothetical protein